MLAGGPPEPLATTLAPEVWGGLRRSAKQAVIGRNVRRAVDAAGGVPRGELVTLVGGCASDPEVIEAAAAELGDLDVAVARGNVLGPPRPARRGRRRARAGLRGGRVSEPLVLALVAAGVPEDIVDALRAGFEEESVPLAVERADGTGQELGRAAAGRAAARPRPRRRRARGVRRARRRAGQRRTCEAPLADVRAFAQDAARIAGRRPLRRRPAI